MPTEGLDVLHHATKSFGTSLFFYFINILSMTGNVIYLTIYDKFMLSRKIQKLRKYFFDWSQSKKYKTNFIWYFTGRNSKNTKHESSATRWPYRTSYDPAYS